MTATDPVVEYVEPTREEVLADPIAAKVHRLVTRHAQIAREVGWGADLSGHLRGYAAGAARAAIEVVLMVGDPAQCRAVLICRAADLAVDEALDEQP